MKSLIKYKRGTAPHSVLSGTTEELITAMGKWFDVMEHNGFYFDKNNPRTLGATLRIFTGPHPPHEYYMIVDADKWQDKQNAKKLPEYDIMADGEKGWNQGAWVIAFVYSNKGNFVLKGYYREVKKHLTELGIKYFVNYTMWHSGQQRAWWKTSMKDVSISEPDKYNNFKWVFRKSGKNWKQLGEIKFKRLPKSWVPEIEALTHLS